MKKIMSLVLAVTLLMSVFGGLTVFAADASGIPDDYEKVDAVVETVTKEWLENQGYETVDPVSKVNELYGWKVYDADKDEIAETLEIFYTGMPKGYTSKDYKTRPWQDQVKTITALVIKGTPTRVPQYGFQEMSALKSVKLAGTEQAVEKGAFANCKALTGVISIPKTATEIKAQAFQNTKVTGLIFEGDAETAPIAVDSFAYMGKLSNITLMRSLTTAKKTVKDFGGAYAGGSWGMASPAKINVLTTDASFISDLAELTAYTDYQLASTNTTNITNKEYKVVENATATLSTAGLVLQDAVVIRYKVAITGGLDGVVAKLECDGNEWEIEASEFQATGSEYYVFFAGLNAAEMSAPVTFTLYREHELRA